jgi:hypothetical protein
LLLVEVYVGDRAARLHDYGNARKPSPEELWSGWHDALFLRRGDEME